MGVGAVDRRRITRIEDHPELEPIRAATLVVQQSAAEGWGSPAQSAQEQVRVFTIAKGWTEETVQSNLSGGKRDGPDSFFGKSSDGELVAFFAPSLRAKVAVGESVEVNGKRYSVFAKNLGMNVGAERAWAAIPVVFGDVSGVLRDQQRLTMLANVDSYNQYFRVPPGSIRPTKFDARGKVIDEE